MVALSLHVFLTDKYWDVVSGRDIRDCAGPKRHCWGTADRSHCGARVRRDVGPG